MSATNFNTANQTLRQLLGNGLAYHVPPFQRDYSWTQDQWDDLWQDVQGVLTDIEPAHYLGYLVLQTQDNKNFQVIDGQQRITTLSLMILAVLKALDELVKAGLEVGDNQKRIEQLRNSYIGFLDPVTLIPHAKLTLNRNNDGYYRDFLIPLGKLPQRGLRASERLLKQAFEWFCGKVRDDYGSKKLGAELARFVDRMSDKLFFTVITVTDELNAFKVFETLNARGVRLSPTDLLKNYLFSVVHRQQSPNSHEIAALERRWEQMVGRLGGESFPDFLRVHWNSRRKFVREADLFKTIRSETPDKARVFELLRQMEEDLDVYAALHNPEDSLWTSGQRTHVAELRMFSVRQPWPLLLAAHRAFDETGFTDVLRAIAVISFRYNVICGLATNDQERAYNFIAQQIAQGDVSRPADAVHELDPLYITDEQFSLAFAEKTLRTTSARNKRVVRYILFALERHLTGHEFDFDSHQYTLEHILPENPEANWPQWTDEQATEGVYRLGNMTVLEAGENREAGNAEFTKKAAAYSKSAFELTSSIAKQNSEWTIERVAKRQNWMAKQARTVWRIGQFG